MFTVSSTHFSPRIVLTLLEPTDVPAKDRLAFPQWKVTLGSAVYVYATSSNLQFIATLGFAAATATICGLLTAALPAGIACAVVASAIYFFVQQNRIPNGRCYEFRFSLVGGGDGVKRVPTSLC